MVAPNSPVPSIRRPSSFRRVYREGSVVRRRFLDLRFLAKPGAPLQLGVTIPRKVGNAVERNRLRRRIRESARLQPRDLFAGDVVVHCRPGAAVLAGGALRQELDGLWSALRRHST